MKPFNEDRALDLIELGVRLALNEPGKTITIDIREISVHIELKLDEFDRNDPIFLEALPKLALGDVKRKLEGREPRFVTVRKYGMLVLEG